MLNLSHIFAAIFLALLAGVALASFTESSLALSWFFLLLAALFLGAHVLVPSKRVVFVALCSVAVGFGVFRFVVWRDAPVDLVLDSLVGHRVLLSGLVIDEPDVREKNTRLTVRIQSVGRASSTSVAFGNILVSADRYPEYAYGDLIVLEGKLDRPRVIEEEDGRVFDYPAYLASKGVRYQMSFANIERKSSGGGNALVQQLFNIKHRFQAALSDSLPEPGNSLASGLLLGGKQSMGREWLDLFRISGIVHIVVLSGYNMTVVSEWLVALFRFLGFYGSLSVGSIGIMLFTIMTGAGATVLRAAVMALIALLARATGKTYVMGRALLIAGVLMVLENPSILAFDPSFQLSFLASLGLVFIAPIIDDRFPGKKKQGVFREVVVSTLATQLAVLPLLLYQTGMLSLVALPANLLVLPIIPLTMLLSFIAGGVALLVPALAVLAGVPAHLFLTWILSVAKYASAIPFASVGMTLHAITVVLLYAVLGWWIWREHQRLSRRVSLSLVLQEPLSSSANDRK